MGQQQLTEQTTHTPQKNTHDGSNVNYKLYVHSSILSQSFCKLQRHRALWHVHLTARLKTLHSTPMEIHACCSLNTSELSLYQVSCRGAAASAISKWWPNDLYGNWRFGPWHASKVQCMRPNKKHMLAATSTLHQVLYSRNVAVRKQLTQCGNVEVLQMLGVPCHQL